MPRRDISVEALRHKDKRRNIPTAELEPVMDEKDKTPIRLAYERRNRDLDPQLVWRGKDEQDWSAHLFRRRAAGKRIKSVPLGSKTRIDWV